MKTIDAHAVASWIVSASHALGPVGVEKIGHLDYSYAEVACVIERGNAAIREDEARRVFTARTPATISTHRFEAMAGGDLLVYQLDDDGTYTTASAAVGLSHDSAKYPHDTEGMLTVVVKHAERYYVFSFSEADGYAFCECQQTGENWTLPPVPVQSVAEVA